MLKRLMLSGLLLAGTSLCVASSETPIRRSDSGIFYIGDRPVTAHEAARKATTPLDAKLDGLFPVVIIDGKKQRITPEELVAIAKTQELGILAGQHRLLPRGSYPDLVAQQNALARELTVSEERAKIALISKLHSKIETAKEAIMTVGSSRMTTEFIAKQRQVIKKTQADIICLGGGKPCSIS